MSRPRRLRFPTDRITRSTTLLQRSLRGIHRRFDGDEVSRDEARSLGEAAIKQNFENLIQEINEYVESRGVHFGVTGTETELRGAMTDTIGRWNRIVDDL